MTTCVVVGCSENTFESKICQDCWEKKPKSNMMEEYKPGVSIRKWLEKEGWGNVPKWNGSDPRAQLVVPNKKPNGVRLFPIIPKNGKKK